MSEERCVCCGEIIPEGRQVCQRCVNDAYYFIKDEEPNFKTLVKEFFSKRDWFKVSVIALLITILIFSIYNTIILRDKVCVEPILETEPVVVETVQPTETVDTTPTETTAPTEPAPTETQSTEATEGSSEAPSAPVTEETKPVIDPDELEMLACVIYQEAGGNGSCDDCRRYVADIVLNRINHPKFPDTMEEVLTAQGQYGMFHYTGIKWAERAKYDTEKEAVERAYQTARDILSGNHSKLYGEGYIWQARFVQGTEGFWCCGHWYGR